MGGRKLGFVWMMIVFLVVQLEAIALLKIDVEPKYVEMNIKTPKTQEVTVQNQTGEFIRYKVSLKKPKNLLKEYYLGDDLIIYPKVISLKPNGRQVVRLRLKNAIKGKEGDYASIIHFEELKANEPRNTETSEEEGANVNIGFKVALDMYVLGSSGEVVPKVEIKNMTVKELIYENRNIRQIVFNTRNTGKSFFMGGAKVKVIDGGRTSIIGEGSFGLLNQKEEREFKIDVSGRSKGEMIGVEVYDRRNPNEIIFKRTVEI